MINIAIAGSTGFLGTRLTEALLKRNYNVINIMRAINSNSHQNSHSNSQLILYEDLNDNYLSKIDILINLVCCYGKKSESLSEMVDANINVPIKLYEFCMKNDITYINLGTILSSEVSMYALTKKHFQDILKMHQSPTKAINLVIDQFYGKNSSETNFITYFLNRLKYNKKNIKLSSGFQRREFIYIDDVISAFLFLIGNIKNIPSNINEIAINTKQPIALKDFLTEIENKFKIIDPNCCTKLLFGALEMRPGESDSNFDEYISLIEFGWKPQDSISSGISKFLK